MSHRAFLPGLAALALLCAPLARGQAPGVSEERVLFGQSAAFTGPTADLGNSIRTGIEAAFREANARGGVHGRRLELKSVDDAYEPEQAITNTRKLIEDPEDPVFALIGAVGTPTSRSAAPVAAEAGVPYVAPFTGAEVLRGTNWEHVVNLRASYNQETDMLVNYLIYSLGITRIAVLHQEDSYGNAGLYGVQQALANLEMPLFGTTSYTRNTTAVKTALLDLQETGVDAVIMVGAYKPVAATVLWARRIGFKPVFMTISFSGGYALARELGAEGEGVYVTQVVPFPTSGSRLVTKYRRALRAQSRSATPGFVSLEGYLAGRLAVVGLERAGKDLNRAAFLESLLRSDPIDLDGFQLKFGPGDNQGSDAVFLTMIQKDGSYRPLTTASEAESE